MYSLHCGFESLPSHDVNIIDQREMLTKTQKEFIIVFVYPLLFSMGAWWWIYKLFPSFDPMEQLGLFISLSGVMTVVINLIYYFFIDNDRYKVKKEKQC